MIWSEDGDMVPTCNATSWCMCMDFQKLSKVTRKAFSITTLRLDPRENSRA